MAFRLASPRSALLAAAALFVDGRPSPSFRFLFGDAARLLALGYVIGFALLLVGVFGFITTWHDHLRCIMNAKLALRRAGSTDRAANGPPNKLIPESLCQTTSTPSSPVRAFVSRDGQGARF